MNKSALVEGLLPCLLLLLGLYLIECSGANASKANEAVQTGKAGNVTVHFPAESLGHISLWTEIGKTFLAKLRVPSTCRRQAK